MAVIVDIPGNNLLIFMQVRRLLFSF